MRMALQTLERGLQLLDWVASNQDTTAARAAEALGVPRSTAYHLVNTLLQTRYLRREDDGRLRLGSSLGSLFAAFAGQALPNRELLAVATDLHDRTEETTFLTIRQGHDAMVVFSCEGSQRLKVSGVVPGLTGRSNCRAAGKAILAYLPQQELDQFLSEGPLLACTPNSITDPDELRKDLVEIASDGLSWDNQEFELGVSSLGVPFFNYAGNVAGAFVVSVFTGRFDEAMKCLLREHLLEAGRRASALLGYTGPYPVIREMAG
jgi:DNA-binding IclR family transcriptional regulator